MLSFHRQNAMEKRPKKLSIESMIKFKEVASNKRRNLVTK
jgi:hypothetical protein